MGWITNAKVKTMAEKIAERDEALAEGARVSGITTARETSGLKKITIEQAENWIDIQLDAATTVVQLREATRKILKKMVPHILD